MRQKATVTFAVADRVTVASPVDGSMKSALDRNDLLVRHRGDDHLDVRHDRPNLLSVGGVTSEMVRVAASVFR